MHKDLPDAQIILKEQENAQFPEHTALFARIAQPCLKLLSPSSFMLGKCYGVCSRTVELLFSKVELIENAMS